MNPGPTWQARVGLRIGTLLFPPFGLYLLWRSPQRWGRKVLGTVGILLFSVLYVAAVAWILVRLNVLKVEWRGGYIPALTPRKTLPDYAAIEKHRASQSRAPQPEKEIVKQPAYWTGFRGPQHDGVYAEQPILTNWPAVGLRRLWHQPCGDGYASFAIAEGKAFTIEQRREQEVVIAYDVESGREVWSHGWKASFSESMGGDGPRATPAYKDGRVFALGALGELRCLQASDGTLVWGHDILAETGASRPTYGVSASPLVVDEKLIVLSAAGRGKSVLCYDAADGKLLWSALDDETGYCSPIPFTCGGERQLIICGGTRTVGLDLEQGHLRWECAWRVLNNQLPIAQPVIFATNRFMLSAGYFTGCMGIEVERTAAGHSARTLWKNKNLKNKFTSSVYWEGHLYGLDEDILTCLDAATGERKWKSGRYGYGQLVLASGHLVILSGDGELALVRATPEKHEELARFEAIKGKTWNHPAIAAGRLLVRNGAEMACFDISINR
jgi:outer membrane protein assembly factor BamB